MNQPQPHARNATEPDAATPDTQPAREARRAPGGFPVVGIIGGGQLARMCAAPAAELALTLSVFAESDDAAAALVVPHAPVGDYRDAEQVREWARGCDVVTFDHEHVPADVLAALEADGVALHPRPSALRFAQDKLAMRQRLSDLDVPCPAWAPVSTSDELSAFGEQHGWPLVLKTPTGGYDGKGVMLVRTPDDADAWFAQADGAPLLAEEAVAFEREIAVMIARSPSGQVAVWPVVETVQVDGICTEVLAPAPDLSDDAAERITSAAITIARELDVTGVMAVELFDVGGGEFVVNELAMRPHNSGHWSMDGSVTGQFEQHLRAVLDLPLGDTRARAPWTVMGNVLGGEYEELYPTYKHLMARDPGLKIHLYGKGVRPGRKIGHVNVFGDDLVGLRARARHACDYLQGTVTE
ncbi:5-(carboxyamino)imidazole ribonucleotide synthase [Dermacoccus nishinomiyaensis]|uniref:N5-carboxyaminoimidazole ribonucleotide synthase n=2 Tax=Dermacoccus TaxID=57495 RepID=A0A075JHA0_9MICO|nr:5-(carboxyamino)imidazole ribonucleotide synthase [Dermacoccus nishinomiyaensis]AIF41289.1 phosphoribosylaminoimidazole carboxylase [Dermacoccus nishinomiyaensis]NHC31586.1 5-(carboxyamino)imidazole ribonucleotide synthase [Dermacoccus nishinomiyaensis]QQY24158.1 5-(carboxyamino)imidazole ribonucleotide synthase [Dermacoccus nishinomiyaensis]TJZ98743.1 5-(carboxyamino)imidazole ribonucleotide synthase [Dermacoccus nishinomiyaensis]STD71212.1 N5-carboxyaminoimidazole ribonucleotide synthase 